MAEEGKKVLVVEDHEAIRKFLVQKLKTFATVLDAGTWAEARERLNTHRFDAFVSDYDLGRDGNGLELLKKVREMGIYKDTPFVLMSGDFPEGVMEDAQALGATCLHKPLTPEVYREFYQLLGIEPIGFSHL